MAWSNDYETPKSKRGMFKGRSLSSLEAQDKHVSGKKKHQVDFAIRAKTGWGKVKEQVVTEAKDWDSMSKEAKDLVLHADNDSDLHRQSHQPIIKNLAKKHDNGVYDSDKATKLWGYHADRAAMSCCKKHGGGKEVWHKMFPTSARKEAASHWEALHRDSLHESINENEEFPLNTEDYQKEILAMLQAAMDDQPATFAEHFANAVQPRLEDTIAAMKAELRKFVFNHTQGNFMEGVNGRSRMLLSSKAKKGGCKGPAWMGGKVPADTVDLNNPANDFGGEGPIGTQHA